MTFDTPRLLFAIISPYKYMQRQKQHKYTDQIHRQEDSVCILIFIK